MKMTKARLEEIKQIVNEPDSKIEQLGLDGILKLIKVLLDELIAHAEATVEIDTQTEDSTQEILKQMLAELETVNNNLQEVRQAIGIG